MTLLYIHCNYYLRCESRLYLILVLAMQSHVQAIAIAVGCIMGTSHLADM